MLCIKHADKWKHKIVGVHVKEPTTPTLFSIHFRLLLLQGTCQSCGAGGPNLWACLQVNQRLQILCIFVILEVVESLLCA